MDRDVASVQCVPVARCLVWMSDTALSAPITIISPPISVISPCRLRSRMSHVRRHGYGQRQIVSWIRELLIIVSEVRYVIRWQCAKLFIHLSNSSIIPTLLTFPLQSSSPLPYTFDNKVALSQTRHYFENFCQKKNSFSLFLKILFSKFHDKSLESWAKNLSIWRTTINYVSKDLVFSNILQWIIQ